MSTSLMSKNAERLLATYDAVNRRDLDGSLEPVAEEYRLIDHAQRQTVEGRQAAREWMEAMLAASSDLHCSATVVVDLGDLVVIRVTAEGTSDGSWGGIEPTHRKFRVEQCELHRFDSRGLVVESELFYDMYGLLADIGVVPALDAV